MATPSQKSTQGAAPGPAQGAAPSKMTVEEAIQRLREDPTSALSLDLDDDMLLELRNALNPYDRVVGPARNAQSLRSVAMAQNAGGVSWRAALTEESPRARKSNAPR